MDENPSVVFQVDEVQAVYASALLLTTMTLTSSPLVPEEFGAVRRDDDLIPFADEVSQTVANQAPCVRVQVKLRLLDAEQCRRDGISIFCVVAEQTNDDRALDTGPFIREERFESIVDVQHAGLVEANWFSALNWK